MTNWKKGHSVQSVRPVSAHTHNPLTAGQSTRPSRTPVPNVAIPASSRPTGDVPLRTFFLAAYFSLEHAVTGLPVVLLGSCCKSHAEIAGFQHPVGNSLVTASDLDWKGTSLTVNKHW